MLNPYKRFFVMALVAIVVLLTVVMPIVAQEEPEPETPAPDTVIVLPDGTPPPEFAFEGIVKAIYSIIYLPFAGAFVQILTQVTKPLPFLKNVRASVIVFVWTGVVWIVYVIVVQLGYGDQFQNVISILTTIGAMAIGIQFTPQVAQYFYTKNQTANPGVLGYSRPLRMEQVATTMYTTPDSSNLDR